MSGQLGWGSGSPGEATRLQLVRTLDTQEPQPCFAMIIPVGCFGPTTDGFAVSDLSCGVQVALLNE
jgi:hypothetical protein